MTDAISMAFKVAASGLRAESVRLRVISENIANAQSTSDVAGGDPYRRQTVSFSGVLDRTSGATLVMAQAPTTDSSSFKAEYNPSHPGADENGRVKTPNVDMAIELADMRDANRAYQASLQMFRQAREMSSMTIELLKG